MVNNQMHPYMHCKHAPSILSDLHDAARKKRRTHKNQSNDYKHANGLYAI